MLNTYPGFLFRCCNGSYIFPPFFLTCLSTIFYFILNPCKFMDFAVLAFLYYKQEIEPQNYLLIFQNLVIYVNHKMKLFWAIILKHKTSNQRKMFYHFMDVNTEIQNFIRSNTHL